MSEKMRLDHQTITCLKLMYKRKFPILGSKGPLSGPMLTVALIVSEKSSKIHKSFIIDIGL